MMGIIDFPYHAFQSFTWENDMENGDNKDL